jgi:hypothetical protein
MERLSMLLIALFLILCIGQVYSREPFATADISNATVTMSLSDLLFYSGNKGAAAVPPAVYNPLLNVPYDPYFSGSGGSDLSSYLYLKNEMTREFKEKLKTSGGYSLNPVNVEPPSCTQGSSYMETVPLKVPASCSQ